jgi:hypothetical protein
VSIEWFGDGQQQDLVTLIVEKSEPVTIQFCDSRGKPVPNIRVLPTQRKLKDGTEYLSYPQHVGVSGFATDEKGEVRFASWNTGEQGAIVYEPRLFTSRVMLASSFGSFCRVLRALGVNSYFTKKGKQHRPQNSTYFSENAGPNPASILSVVNNPG